MNKKNNNHLFKIMNKALKTLKKNQRLSNLKIKINKQKKKNNKKVIIKKNRLNKYRNQK